jgi:hypothetical protein
MRKYWLTFTFVVVAAALCAAQEQSLGDLARHKASSRKATHVYTEDDIPTHPVTAPPDDASTGAPDSQSSSDKKPGKSSADPNGKSGSAEVEGARKFVQAKQVQIDAVKQEIKRYQAQLLHETDDAKVESLQTSIKNLEHNIGAWTEQRDGAQKVVDKAENDKPAQSSKPAASSDSAQPRQ